MSVEDSASREGTGEPDKAALGGPASVESSPDSVPVTPLRDNRDFRRLWISETVSELGTSMSMLVFPLIALSVTGSVIQASLVGAAHMLSTTLLRLPAGVLVDRLNRKMILIVASVVPSVLFASLAVAAAADVLTLAHLVAVAFAAGALRSFFEPTEVAMVRRVVTQKQLPRAFSLNQARGQVAAIAGPALGGALYTLGRWIPFAADAVSYAFAAFMVSRLSNQGRADLARSSEGAEKLAAPTGEGDASSSRSTLRSDLVEGVRFLLARPFFRSYAAFAALANFSIQALFLVMVLKLSTAGITPAAIGMVEGTAAAAGLVGALMAARIIEAVPSGPLAITAGVVLAVAVVPMAFTNNPLIIGALFAVAMLLNPAGNAAVSAYVTSITPDAMQGRVGAGLTFCATTLQPAAPLFGGLLLEAFGGRTAMLMCASITAMSVIPLLINRAVRTLPKPSAWPELNS